MENQTFRIQYCDKFASIEGDEQSRVFQLFPKLFVDNRGFFTEVLNKDNNQLPAWMHDFSWVSQINKSSSFPGVCRGLHAQKGRYCQSKLVECIDGLVLDIIVDARPDSKTYRQFECFLLDSEKQNKLFVPKGFLHGFYSMKKDLDGKLIDKCNIFQYFVGGGSYNKESEVNVDMSTIIKYFDSIQMYHIEMNNGIARSEKDGDAAIHIVKFFDDMQQQYEKNGKLWYR